MSTSNPWNDLEPVITNPNTPFPFKVNPDGIKQVGSGNRAVLTLQPVAKEVFIASFEAAKLARAQNTIPFSLVNVSPAPIDDLDHNEQHWITDTDGHTEEKLRSWITHIASFIEMKRSLGLPVLVNCRAGCNRSNIAVIAWMLMHTNVASEEEYHVRFKFAFERIQTLKSHAARVYKTKNRFQSFEKGKPTFHRYSWPLLVGKQTIVPQALNVLARIVTENPSTTHEAEMAKAKTVEKRSL